MDQKKRDLLLGATTKRKDGRLQLACAKAFELAKEHDLSLKEISDFCREMDIRIAACQLQCFP